MKIRAFVILALAFASVQPGVVRAQQAQSATLQNQTPPPATTVPPPPPAESLPRPDFRFNGQVGRTYQDSDPPTFPHILRPPKGAPNVLLILLDDVGFDQFSVTGGGVPSPNMEKLAKQGLIYTRFHTTALCSPTRAALISGRDHHVASTGVITELATGYDGYTGIIPEGQATFFAQPDVYPVDVRGVTFSYAYFTPKHLGTGSSYLLAIADKDGGLLQGSATYRL